MSKKNDPKAKLKRKNIAVALLVISLCVLFYFTTIVRLGGAIL